MGLFLCSYRNPFRTLENRTVNLIPKPLKGLLLKGPWSLEQGSCKGPLEKALKEHLLKADDALIPEIPAHYGSDIRKSHPLS